MKILARPICWVSWHNFRVIRVNDLANAHMGHLHYLAGCDADCERCGKEWRDFENFNRYPWVPDPWSDAESCEIEALRGEGRS